jgi:hypothetical protein
MVSHTSSFANLTKNYQRNKGCGSGNVAEQCNFNKKVPIIANSHHHQQKQVLTGFLASGNTYLSLFNTMVKIVLSKWVLRNRKKQFAIEKTIN